MSKVMRLVASKGKFPVLQTLEPSLTSKSYGQAFSMGGQGQPCLSFKFTTLATVGDKVLDETAVSVSTNHP